MSPDVKERLTCLLAEADWTGGGEIEFVRDLTGSDWLIDFNPRFPAYIYGVTLCGYNMPASLIGAALDIDCLQTKSHIRQFIRVVQELPVKSGLPLPRMVPMPTSFPTSGKHPSLQPELVRQIKNPSQQWTTVDGQYTQQQRLSDIPEWLIGWRPPSKTPYRFRDFRVVMQLLQRITEAIDNCRERPRIVHALSIKTDPNKVLARFFLEHGYWAEVISLRELEWVNEIGFKANQIVLNGPAVPGVVSSWARPIGVAFADSIESFRALMKSKHVGTVGLRLRPSAVTSRFGVDLSHLPTFKQIAQILRDTDVDQRLGLHFHIASDMYGTSRWFDLFEHMLGWAAELTNITGKPISVFDVGGGWHIDDFCDVFLPQLPFIQSRVTEMAPSVDTIVFEPGKAISSDSAWLATRIIEVRSNGPGASGEVIVDASIADLPMASHYAHRVFHIRGHHVFGQLTVGSKRILGSICMETDVLAEGVEFPCPPTVGDILIFMSAGGYNSSMAWTFASGVSRDG